MILEADRSLSRACHPTVSVIMPTHFRHRLLSRALKSINAQRHRTDIEVIVISDAIDVDTDSVCGKLLDKQDVYIRRNGACGPSASRNLGLKLARGQFIMFLDDDDAWQDHFSQALFEILPQLALTSAYFNCSVVKESRPPTGLVKLSEVTLDLYQGLTEEVFVKNQIPICCFMFSRHLLEGLQFDEAMRAYEDWDFILGAVARRMPTHYAINCSVVHQVGDSTTDRRGSSEAARNLHAVMDYLYVYRRHPAPNLQIQLQRKLLLASVGLDLQQDLL
jgi:GalNAc5-diNAcBac-PP-undecaprenol beta-1,3-glucosyltransferase